jgi:hypothetical protein
MSDLPQSDAPVIDADVMERLGWLFDRILGRQQRQGITDPREVAAAIIALWHVVVSDHNELVELRLRVAKLERFLSEPDGRG